MELTDFLDPVALDKPEEYLLQQEALFSKKITIHTENFEFDDLSKFDVAILGVPEDRNSFNRGTSLGPNAVRSELYKLISPFNKTSIIDLGNIKAGNTFSDTYFALKDVVYRLLCNNVVTIIIGGSQELSMPVFQALENLNSKINLTVFDSKIDSHKDALKPNADSYLFELLLKKQKLFKFVHAGHQTYLTDQYNIDLVSKLFHEAIRLGEVRQSIKLMEPILRDSDFVSFDIGCVRNSDAPGHFRPTPNGFYAEEACQLSRYAGAGDKVRVFGVFETNPRFDSNNVTSALSAQLIWHFLDGVEFRVMEYPNSEDSNFKTFIVSNNDLDFDMVFYKSMLTERWWLDVRNTENENVLVSCAPEDYQTACNNEVPDIWWNVTQKLS